MQYSQRYRLTDLRRTTFFGVEDASSLIEQTLDATVRDMRIAEDLYPAVPEEKISATEAGLAAVRDLLPCKVNSHYEVRCTYGWTVDELEQVCNLLNRAIDAFDALKDQPLPAGTVEQLVRSREEVRKLLRDWAILAYFATEPEHPQDGWR